MTEAEIKNQICEYLSYLGVFFWVQQAGKIPGRINRSKYLRNGISDIIGVIDGRLLAIEVKKPGGRASKEQKEFIDEINKHGGVGMIVFSLEEAIKKINESRTTAT